MNMLPFEIVPLVEPTNDPLIEDERRNAAAAIPVEAMNRRVEHAAKLFGADKITFEELDAEMVLIYRELTADNSLTLDQLAAKYPQETADVITRITLNRSEWRPFLQEHRVYINGTNNYYLHRGENAL